ncbi:TIGR03086 family metal-binding protein [Serinicoccus kebangsaanensis]|uniref:TIGR03086 family metal-binding protein n=1 Tax=Serinicoccus kebangsaanensis TaxID=2602069 RepID=UPI00124D42C7|nr:TIGR03086 family metal-binding protein [Serinicoccus kebangsaanensis]
MIDLTPATTRVAGLLDGVDDAQLGAPTPNQDMTVTALLHHVLGLTVAFRDAAAKIEGPTTQTPPEVSDEPLPDAWREQLRDRLTALAQAWSEESAWEGMTTAGGVTFPAEACGLVALDEVLLHGWDLAVATGQDYEVPDDEAEAVLPIVTPSGDAETDAEARDGMFGPPVEVPDDASTFDRVLGLSGRDPRWAHRQ